MSCELYTFITSLCAGGGAAFIQYLPRLPKTSSPLSRYLHKYPRRTCTAVYTALTLVFHLPVTLPHLRDVPPVRQSLTAWRRNIMAESVTIRTKKFITNRLLQRKQFVRWAHWPRSTPRSGRH